MPRQKLHQRFRETPHCMYQAKQERLWGKRLMIPWPRLKLGVIVSSFYYYIYHPPTCSSMGFNFITRKHSEKEENEGRKKRKESILTYEDYNSFSCTYLQLIIDLPHLLSLFHPCFLLHTLLPSVLHSYSASILYPHAMGVGLSSPPRWLFSHPADL